MGFSVTISHAIILIASVIVASSFALVMVSKTNVFSSILSQNINKMTLNSQIDFSIIYSYYDGEDNAFILFVKNTGHIELNDNFITKSDIYIISNGKVQLLTYGTSRNNQWFYVDTNNVPGWQIGETMIFKAYNQSSTNHKVIIKIALPNGMSRDSVIWLGD